MVIHSKMRVYTREVETIWDSTEPRTLRIKLADHHGPGDVHVCGLAGGEGGCHVAQGGITGGVLHEGVHLGASRAMQEEHGAVGRKLNHP